MVEWNVWKILSRCLEQFGIPIEQAFFDNTDLPTHHSLVFRQNIADFMVFKNGITYSDVCFVIIRDSELTFVINIIKVFIMATFFLLIPSKLSLKK